MLPEDLDRTFDAVLLSSDAVLLSSDAVLLSSQGTYPPSSRTTYPCQEPLIDRLRRRIEALSLAGVHTFVLGSEDVESLDARLRARPRGRGRLHLCCEEGSRLYKVDRAGPILLSSAVPSRSEARSLSRASKAVSESVLVEGVATRLVVLGPGRRRLELSEEDRGRSGTNTLTRAHRRHVGDARSLDDTYVARIRDRAGRLTDAAVKIRARPASLEMSLWDRGDHAELAASWLESRGITGGLVLVAGFRFGEPGTSEGQDRPLLVGSLSRASIVSFGAEPEASPEVLHMTGGVEGLLHLLDDQLCRRRDRRVPSVDADPAWVVELPLAREKARVAEAIGALSNGWVGSRASKEEGASDSQPLLLVSGAYTDNGGLLRGPDWTGLQVSSGHHHPHETRLLDMRTGVLARLPANRRGLRSLRFVSRASPDALALRAEAEQDLLAPGPPLHPPGGTEIDLDAGDGTFMSRTNGGETEIAVAASDSLGDLRGLRTVERLAAWKTGAPGGDAAERARAREIELRAEGFDLLLAEHREAWARLWADTDVLIEGGDGALADLRATRFCLFHLLSAARDVGEAAVGARGLTGEAYSGHVFWDTEVYVLPSLAAMLPAAARAVLEYRIRRLPAARSLARARGLSGARFPWESASDGQDVTPKVMRWRRGGLVPVTTGQNEEHIVADVAWAAARYSAWTGDEAFLEGAGRPLLVETARYWQSRIRVGSDARGHLDRVMGPDEYHEAVDDNAFTNVMARWNMRKAAGVLAKSGDPEEAEEAAHLQVMADLIVDGWCPDRMIYEQFAGYFELEPLFAGDIAPPPAALDVLLGRDRVASSQLIKQADVLMLHHLVPEEVAPGSLEPCLDFYGPRTAHGSSLSPAVQATLLARAGRTEEALEFFRIATRLDLEDLTGTTSNGLHLATMGGVWQAVAHGFLGLSAHEGALAFDPHLPAAWSSLGLRFHFRGKRVAVRASREAVVISCDEPLLVLPPRGRGRIVAPPGATLRLASSRARGEGPRWR